MNNKYIYIYIPILQLEFNITELFTDEHLQVDIEPGDREMSKYCRFYFNWDD